MRNYADLNVLVVEDHTFQRTFIVNALRQLDIVNISEASDGIEALAEVERLRSIGTELDFILFDLQMPNMDGIVFVRHLSDKNYNGSASILSAMDSSLIASVTKMVKEYKLNYIGSLAKPVSLALLKEQLEEVLKNVNRVSDSALYGPKSPQGYSEDQLIQSLYMGGIVPFFQPKYSFESNKLIGVEALVRLSMPDGNIVSPFFFLYLFDKLGKTKDFELQTYDQAFAACKNWQNHSHDIKVSINVSASMASDEIFFNEIIALTEKHQVNPKQIIIEVTEDAIIKDIAMSIETLSRLRMRGFGLSVDDFGTGYSSIKQLEMFPFTELKIDQSFILNIENDEQKQAIVKSTFDLAQSLGLETVAEGVETLEAWDILKAYGVTTCQGYISGKPMQGEHIIGSLSFDPGERPTISLVKNA